MNQNDVIMLLQQYKEYIELIPNNTEELRNLIRDLKAELDLRKIRYVDSED